jgi:hypothetical protein
MAAEQTIILRLIAAQFVSKRVASFSPWSVVFSVGTYAAVVGTVTSVTMAGS